MSSLQKKFSYKFNKTLKLDYNIFNFTSTSNFLQTSKT
jgi:hypothetical protein